MIAAMSLLLNSFFVSAESTWIFVVTAICVRSKRLLHLEFETRHLRVDIDDKVMCQILCQLSEDS